MHDGIIYKNQSLTDKIIVDTPSIIVKLRALDMFL